MPAKWPLIAAPGAQHIGPGPVLLVAEQHSQPTVWTEEPTGTPIELTRTVELVATGGQVPPGGRHLGSCVCAGGALVWHLYEVPSP